MAGGRERGPRWGLRVRPHGLDAAITARGTEKNAEGRTDGALAPGTGFLNSSGEKLTGGLLGAAP